jgi:predicted AlkP superfamily phosphohydrolase/phosphomutase
MKLLIVGIDGGDRQIIDAMDMPFTQNLLNERTHLNIREDLWSRGWSEILTGLHGVETGAFYEKPKLDGSLGFTQSYKLEDYYKTPGCVPIWDKLNEMGLKSGFTNIPTTIPAPKVDGFFIAGAGSGFSPSSRVPANACQPAEIAAELLDQDFIWEQRFRVSGVRDFDVFIERCVTAVKQRTELFIKLSRQHNIDVGFIMHREFSTLTNLFAFIIKKIVDRKGRAHERHEMRIAHFYRVLDDLINATVLRLNPDHIIVVSDHSVAQYEHSINLNAFLNSIGMHEFEKSPKKTNNLNLMSRAKLGFIKYLRDKISPDYYTYKLKSWETFKIVPEGARAFSNNYVPGIYINDDRFLSLVSSSEKESLKEHIISKFNATREAKEYGLNARIYREKYGNSHSNALLPDIWIDIPDTFFPEAKGEFVQKNPYYKSYHDLSYAHRDIMSGIKGRKALCAVEPAIIDKLEKREEYDLTIAYYAILQQLENA